MPPKKPKPFAVPELSKLDHYRDDELYDLREQLLADITRIEGERRQADERIKAFNIRKQELDEERADRARAIRAVKHMLNQRQRGHVATAPRGKLRAAR